MRVTFPDTPTPHLQTSTLWFPSLSVNLNASFIQKDTIIYLISVKVSQRAERRFNSLFCSVASAEKGGSEDARGGGHLFRTMKHPCVTWPPGGWGVTVVAAGGGP